MKMDQVTGIILEVYHNSLILLSSNNHNKLYKKSNFDLIQSFVNLNPLFNLS